MAETYRAVVTRVDSAGVWVQVPVLGSELEFGPCDVAADSALMTAGERVLVGTISGGMDDVVIFGALDADTANMQWRYVTGVGAPANTLGNDHDWALNDAGKAYEKVAGVWVLRESLVGPTGATGPTGPAGDAVYSGDKNMINNPSFDVAGAATSTDNQLASWNGFWRTGPSGGGATAVRDTTPANIRTGAGAAKLSMADNTVRTETNPVQRIGSDHFVVAPGELITVSVYARGGAASGITLTINLMTNTGPAEPDFFVSGTTNQGKDFANPATAYTKYTASFLVPAGHTLGRVYFSLTRTGTAACDLWLDDAVAMREAGSLAAGATQPLIRRLLQLTRSPNMGNGGIKDYVPSAYTNPGVRWSAPITITDAGRGSQLWTDGLCSITCPFNGVVITGYGGAANVTVNAAGRIPLANNTTLYFDVPLGAAASGATDNNRFKVVGNTADFDVPATWVPIVTRSDSVPSGGTNIQLVRWWDGTEDTGWIGVGDGYGPAFQNAWVNFDVRTVRFRRLNGVVYIDGIAKNGTVNTVMFNLPVGFRTRAAAAHDKNLPTESNSATGYLGIDGSTGAVMLAVGSNAWVDLSSIPPYVAEG